MPIVGDLDGDGTRDAVYASDSERDLLLTSCPTPQRVTGSQYETSFFVGFDHPQDATPLNGAADLNNDGRVDICRHGCGILRATNFEAAGRRFDSCQARQRKGSEDILSFVSRR